MKRSKLFDYPLFSPKLMEEHTFCYAIPSFRHSIPGERTSGSIGYAVDEAKRRGTPNCMTADIDRFRREIDLLLKDDGDER